jgi:hypothetical protein
MTNWKLELWRLGPSCDFLSLVRNHLDINLPPLQRRYEKNGLSLCCSLLYIENTFQSRKPQNKYFHPQYQRKNLKLGEITSNMSSISDAKSILSGSLFGAALTAAGVYSPTVIVSQMKLESFHMLKVFLSASATSS